MVGFKTEIPHLNGRKIVIERDTVTSPGTKIRRKGEGMPNYENNIYGYLIITIDIQFPTNNFTEQDKEGIHTFFFFFYSFIVICSYKYLLLQLYFICFRSHGNIKTKLCQ